MAKEKSIESNVSKKRWQFWIDRGGTFTDIVAQKPDSSVVTHKLLSVNQKGWVGFDKQYEVDHESL